MAVTIAATVSKRTARRALAEIVVGPDLKTVGYRNYSTSGAGDSDTAVIAALSGIGADYVLALPWGVCNDGTNAGEFRRAIELSGTSVNFANAFTNAIATTVDMDFYPYRPSDYHVALNRAIPAVWPGIYRYLTSHIITNAERKEGQGNLYSLPRNIRRVNRVMQWGLLSLRDLFDRAASTTALGNGWTAASGDTYGVSAEELYCVSDVDGDYVTRPESIKDGVIEFQDRGVLASATAFRTFSLMFRHAEDYTGALDHNNYLVVRLLSTTEAASGGVVALRKVDGGTESSLTTATVTTSNNVNYMVRVEFLGARIRVWVDDIQLIDYELTGPNIKYLDNARWGFRVDITGAPGANSGATAARVDNVYAFSAQRPMTWHDWRANRDGDVLECPAISTLAPTGLLLIEGQDLLSAFSTDNVGSLVSDTTAVLELSTSDPSWFSYITAAAAELYALLGYRELEAQTREHLARMPRMAQSQRTVRSAMW